MNLGQYITQQELALVAGDKDELWALCCRNGYLMPPRRDAINTRDWMQGVKDRVYWCLKSSEVHTLKPCADPPSRQRIAEILVERMINGVNYPSAEVKAAFERTAVMIRRKPPSPAWMLQVLANIDPANRVFDKDFVTVREDAKQAEDAEALSRAVIANPDGFFNGVPLSKRRGKKHMVVGDPEYQQRLKMVRMEKQMQKVRERMEREQARFEEKQRKQAAKEAKFNEELRWLRDPDSHGSSAGHRHQANSASAGFQSAQQSVEHHQHQQEEQPLQPSQLFQRHQQEAPEEQKHGHPPAELNPGPNAAADRANLGEEAVAAAATNTTLLQAAAPNVIMNEDEAERLSQQEVSRQPLETPVQQQRPMSPRANPFNFGAFGGDGRGSANQHPLSMISAGVKKRRAQKKVALETELGMTVDQTRNLFNQ